MARQSTIDHGSGDRGRLAGTGAEADREDVVGGTRRRITWTLAATPTRASLSGSPAWRSDFAPQTAFGAGRRCHRRDKRHRLGDDDGLREGRCPRRDDRARWRRPRPDRGSHLRRRRACDLRRRRCRRPRSHSEGGGVHHRDLRRHRHLGERRWTDDLRPPRRSVRSRQHQADADQLLGHRARLARRRGAHARWWRYDHQRGQCRLRSRLHSAGYVRRQQTRGEGLYRCAAHGAARGGCTDLGDAAQAELDRLSAAAAGPELHWTWSRCCRRRSTRRRRSPTPS